MVSEYSLWTISLNEPELIFYAIKMFHLFLITILFTINDLFVHIEMVTSIAIQHK